MKALSQAVARFAVAYHSRADLVREQRGWNLVIALVAHDSGEAIALRVADGRIVDWSGGADGDVVISGDAGTLCDVLELRRGASEPYVFGEITVRGAEGDFLRLDYITSMMGPA